MLTRVLPGKRGVDHKDGRWIASERTLESWVPRRRTHKTEGGGGPVHTVTTRIN